MSHTYSWFRILLASALASTSACSVEEDVGEEVEEDLEEEDDLGDVGDVWDEDGLDTDGVLVLSVPLTLEAESMVLSGYAVDAVDQGRIALDAETGSSTQQLDGNGGTYQIAIHAIGEAAGAPTLDVLIDGALVDSFTYPRTDGPTVFTIDAATLTPSSKIELVGHQDAGARALVDRLEFTPLGAQDDTIAALPSSSCSAKNATLTKYLSLDTSALEGAVIKTYKSGSVAFTTAKKRAGKGAARMRVGSPQLSPSACTSSRYRAEMITKPKQKYGWDDGKSYWVGLSMNPTKFDGTAYTFLQIHAPNEVKGAACDYAGNALTIAPNLINGVVHYTLRVIEKGGQTTGKGSGSGTKRVWHEPMKKNKWTDFVVNFTLSTKGKGFFRVWRNGKMIYQKSGLTNVHHIDTCGKKIPADKRQHNGPHFGIYGPSCKAGVTPGSHFREMFVDELRTATGSNGFGVVSPSCF